MKLRVVLSLFLLLAGANFAFAQTTEFTYQGRLLDGMLPPTANYDFEFSLFATEAGGTALATNQRSGVSVSNGIFTVRLDFAGNFSGNVNVTGNNNSFFGRNAGYNTTESIQNTFIGRNE